MTKRPLVILISSTLLLILLLAAAAVIISRLNFNSSDEPSVARFRDCSELATWLNYSRRPEILPYLSRNVAPAAPVDADSGQSSGGYSTTNVQVAGIDEADVVKTDGTNIYTINDEKVFIHNIQNGQITLIETIVPNIRPNELYVTDNYLLVIGTPFGKVSPLSAPDSDARYILPTAEQYSYVYGYSKQNWKLELSTVVSGYIQSNRLLNDKIYLAINNWQYTSSDYTPDSAEKLLPKYTLDTTGKELTVPETQLASCEEIAYLGDVGVNPVAIVQIDLDKKAVDSEVSFGQINNIYMSFNAIYLTAPEYDSSSFRPCPWWSQLTTTCPPQSYSSSDATNIFKLDLETMNFVATGQVKGSLLNQYSMDEYKENLRLVTTFNEFKDAQSKVTNNVFVLDNELNIKGEITELAPTERIYSARFIEDRVYLVTFRQIDPFFVIDLSDSANPTVLGELKITGYSDYLHPISQNVVLGIGREVDSRTQRIKEVKLSLIDVSDPAKPTEISKAMLASGVDTNVLNNPKALYIELSQNRLALPQYRYDTFNTTYSFALFSFADNKLEIVKELPAGKFTPTKISNAGERVVRIGDYLYTIGVDGIISYTNADLVQVDAISF